MSELNESDARWYCVDCYAPLILKKNCVVKDEAHLRCHSCYVKNLSKLHPKERRIVVYKDGSYQIFDDHPTWEYEGDSNWLVTIPITSETKPIH